MTFPNATPKPGFNTGTATKAEFRTKSQHNLKGERGQVSFKIIWLFNIIVWETQTVLSGATKPFCLPSVGFYYSTVCCRSENLQNENLRQLKNWNSKRKIYSTDCIISVHMPLKKNLYFLIYWSSIRISNLSPVVLLKTGGLFTSQREVQVLLGNHCNNLCQKGSWKNEARQLLTNVQVKDKS